MNAPHHPAGVKILTVGELTRSIKGIVETAFPSIWIEGEISNYRPNRSGHIYLTLKDSQAVLDAVIYRAWGNRLRFEPRNGMKVIACGRLLVYEPQGKYQLAIEDLHPKGVGPQELALQQLKERLKRQGFFDQARKKPLPRFPKSVALIASPTGAAVRDMLQILGQRWPAARVWVWPARMQGEEAAADIAWAIRQLNRLHASRTPTVDVMILGRGGGSVEDLWAFNEEVLARAIFESAIPVVSAIGHEIDVTIADLVADRRAVTPSEAAALVVPDRRELLQRCGEVQQRLRAALVQRLAERRQRLADLAKRRVFRQPLDRIRDHEQRLDDWSNRLLRQIQQRLARDRQRMEALAGQLASLSPLNVLARGYSLTSKAADRTVVRDPAQVQPGDRLLTLVQHGRIVSVVEKTPFTREPKAINRGSKFAVASVAV